MVTLCSILSWEILRTDENVCVTVHKIAKLFQSGFYVIILKNNLKRLKTEISKERIRSLGGGRAPCGILFP